MKEKVHTYIHEHWKETIRKEGSKFNIPPYTSPCVKKHFTCFFYWDTYFTNKGLLLDGLTEQAESNLDVMKFFITFLGYVPNSDTLIRRSQPPLFTRGVYDLYIATKEKRIIEKYGASILREMEFFENDRMRPCGLNGYGNNEIDLVKKEEYDNFSRRLGFSKEEKQFDRMAFVDDLLAIAESGWDFTLRFMREGNRFAATDFAQLDLNCILYDAEMKAAEMFEIIGEKETAKTLLLKAEQRKERINALMLDKTTGIYYDYNYKQKKLSSVCSAVSFYPYALNISKDKEGAKRVLEKLELEHGISAGEYLGENQQYFQWDYPSMWPCNMYFAVEALLAVGCKEEANRVKNKYMRVVEDCFAKTGALWEKYDAKRGTTSFTSEYDTPEMMGWTAGVYEYFLSLE